MLPRQSAGEPPCAPIPGSKSTERGSSSRASATSRGNVAPTTAPTADRPRSPTSSSPQPRTSSATCCQSLRPSASATSCTSALPGFDVFTRQKMPAPSRRHASRKGSIGVAAEIRIDRDGVGKRDERLRVRAGGRTDVAALHVSDDDQACGACVFAHLRECSYAVGAVRFEERRLRFHGDGIRRDRVHDPGAEREEIAVDLGGHLLDRPGRGRRRAGCSCARRRRRAGRRSASPPRSPSSANLPLAR